MFVNPERLFHALDHFLPTLRLRRGLTAALLGGAISIFIPIRPAITLGRSMEPTLHSGQPLLFTSGGTPDHPYRRGDVLVFRTDGIPNVKRVAAVGGQVLWTIPKSKTDPTPIWALAPSESVNEWNKRFPSMQLRRYLVPEGKLFVVGDSPLSRDSREYGPIEEGVVMGRVTWPPVPEEPETETFFHTMVPKPGSHPQRSIRIARR